jgi:hypothetical protein
MESHSAELMAMPGVAGVAIGETEDGTPCILVLSAVEADDIRGRVPREIEGHPVRIFESGEIRPMR